MHLMDIKPSKHLCEISQLISLQFIIKKVNKPTPYSKSTALHRVPFWKVGFSALLHGVAYPFWSS